MSAKKPTKKSVFLALAAKARKTKDSMDIRLALRYGIENRISTTEIRKALR